MGHCGFAFCVSAAVRHNNLDLHSNAVIPNIPRPSRRRCGSWVPELQMGLDGWQALKSGADVVTDAPRQTTPRPILSSISAQLFVANIKSSCDFYTDKLGFAVEFIYGDPPYYGQVVRDNARLALRLVFEPVFVADVRKREHLLSASITLATANEIKQLFLSYQAAGVSFHQALKKESWGASTFVVSDPDENLILFAGPAAD